jgi:hypothetical protein
VSSPQAAKIRHRVAERFRDHFGSFDQVAICAAGEWEVSTVVEDVNGHPMGSPIVFRILGNRANQLRMIDVSSAHARGCSVIPPKDQTARLTTELR